jgi:hypothetical protein
MKIMANEKSKAEQYRDERKARIAEAAKKNAKDMQKKNAAQKAVKKIISVALAVVIAFGAFGLVLDYYGTWERMVKIGDVGEEIKVSAAEYEYYYMSVFSNFLSRVSQYASAGMDYGYDTTLPPADQTKTTEDENGNEITWEEFIRRQVVDQIRMASISYNEAVKMGLELSEDDEKTIDNYVDQIREQAQATTTSNGQTKPKYSVDAFLRMNYGSFMNKSFYCKMLEKELLIQKYNDVKLDELSESYSQADVDKKYNASKGSYDLVDFRIYEFAKTTLTADKGESNDALKKRQTEADKKVKADAEAFLAAITDEASFVAKAKELNKDTKDYDVDSSTKASGMLKTEIGQGISTKVADWLFSAEAKAGAKKMFDSSDAKKYYVILVINPAHQVETVSVRHILFGTTDAQTGEALSEAEIAQKKKDAEAALKEWQEGTKTEESFGSLATELTEDTGSQSTGGLYEGVRQGQMVPEFDKWIFDKSRKTGDTEIVETDYGFHVMYFVGQDGKYYDTTIRNEMAQTDFNAEMEDLAGSGKYSVVFGGARLEYAENQIVDKIRDLLAQSASQSTY